MDLRPITTAGRDRDGGWQEATAMDRRPITIGGRDWDRGERAEGKGRRGWKRERMTGGPSPLLDVTGTVGRRSERADGVKILIRER